MRVMEIAALVARDYGITREQLLSRRRRFARPRQVVMYLASLDPAKTYTQIARELRMDHTTIIYGAAAIEEKASQDAVLGRSIYRLKEEIEERS